MDVRAETDVTNERSRIRACKGIPR